MVLPAFSTAPKLGWFGLLALTIFLEVEPLPQEIYPPLFYSYKLLKGVLFFALGYLTPLAFWRFNSLGRGMLLAALSACAVEMLQGFFQGHRFSLFELGLKLLVIFAGFALALNARYEQRISLGWWRIQLKSEHFHT
ncbi:MAG: VanZ family protein [Bryobacteraceae bacterium]